MPSDPPELTAAEVVFGLDALSEERDRPGVQSPCLRELTIGAITAST